MTFLDHARYYGLIIKDLRMDGRWHRVPTEDKPRKRNGAYLFDGSRGVVKNWATMENFAQWPERGDRSVQPVDVEEIIARRKKADSEAIENRAKACRRAAEDVSMATLATHAYLASKGFPEASGLVLNGSLVIPMRDYKSNALVNVQKVDITGQKRFLPGGQSKGAVLVLGKKAGAEKWLVEGYATGLSVKTALDAMHRRAEVWICFSAGNLTFLAGKIPGVRYVVADNDASGTGQKAAEATGLPWVMPPVVGEDANDLHKRAGLWALVKLLREAKCGTMA